MATKHIRVLTSTRQSDHQIVEIAGLVSVNKVVNVSTYELEKATIGPDGALGPRQAGGLFTGSRAMLLSGLTPGTIYGVHVRAVGGSTKLQRLERVRHPDLHLRPGIPPCLSRPGGRGFGDLLFVAVRRLL